MRRNIPLIALLVAFGCSSDHPAAPNDGGGSDAGGHLSSGGGGAPSATGGSGGGGATSATGGSGGTKDGGRDSGPMNPTDASLGGDARSTAPEAGRDANAPDVEVDAGHASAVALSAGSIYACAVTSSGGAVCWGNNQYGQVGDGSKSNRLAPVQVTGLEHGVTAVATASEPSASDVSVFSACAVVGGAAKCWGKNNYGKLGDGTMDDSAVPVQVSGLTGGVQSVAVGDDATCALTTGGAVKCWGSNAQGQLGDGTGNSSPTPVQVSGLSSGVKSIVLGRYFGCALTSAGGVTCWGTNAAGLGNANATQSSTPTAVDGLSSGVVAIASGPVNVCALTSAGAVQCWGYNSFDELGSGATVSSGRVPVPIVGLQTGVSAIAVGGLSACAVTTTQTIKCWGYGGDGQLGNGTSPPSSDPVDVTGVSTATAVSVGGFYACALIATGGVECWGTNTSGEFGNGTVKSSAVPVSGLD
jgi:alpha-tubulin suppressor-like RCC1 family protein